MLLGTMATLDFLGKIGKDVLREHGIKKIDPLKYYAYELRSAIHKAALDQFGEIALVVSGYTAGENYKDVETGVDKVYRVTKAHLKSNSWSLNKKGIEDIFQSLSYNSRKLLSNSVKDQSGLLNYGYDFKFLGGTKFRFLAAMPQEIYQEPYYRGLNDYYFTKYFGKYFNTDIKFNKRLSKRKYGWTELSWDINFKREPCELSQEKISNIRKNFLKEQLMQSVLKKLENQNKQLKVISHKLGKYLPPQIHESLFSGGFDDQIATRRKKLTIFFSDIKNFTTTSEGLQPEDLTKYLNQYFSEMTTIALDHGATIDKYIGDAMMVFFGDPQSGGEREDARACVEMALRMQERMVKLQNKWSDEGFSDPFQIRIGINTGYCNVGNFGSDQRLTYTIIGGEVNVAQRLEASARANGILLSYETYAHVQDMIEVDEQESIKMKGISREIKLYAVRGRRQKINDQGDGLEKTEVQSKSKSKITLAPSSYYQMSELQGEVRSLRTDIDDIKKNLKNILQRI